jgi:hypothetical protein
MRPYGCFSKVSVTAAGDALGKEDRRHPKPFGQAELAEAVIAFLCCSFHMLACLCGLNNMKTQV